MIVSIHQPNYLPYLGYFDKIFKSDVFVIYDTAYFVKEMFYNRNKVKTNQGAKWLTIPIYYDQSIKQPIKETITDNKRNWKKKHWQTILQSYAKSPYFREVSELLEPLYKNNTDSLSQFASEIIKTLCKYMCIDTKIVFASDLKIPHTEDRTEKLVNICLALDSTVYLSGATGNKYIEENKFHVNNIKVQYQKYDHPIYNQLHGDFIKNMCILDLIFNYGKDSKSILIN